MGKVQFIDERCFGCGACWSVAPDNFTCNDTGRTTMISDEITDAAIEASEICPASAIIIDNKCDNCNCGSECNCSNDTCDCGDECHCTEEKNCGCQSK